MYKYRYKYLPQNKRRFSSKKNSNQNSFFYEFCVGPATSTGGTDGAKEEESTMGTSMYSGDLIIRSLHI